jgi:hypothetical protein
MLGYLAAFGGKARRYRPVDVRNWARRVDGNSGFMGRALPPSYTEMNEQKICNAHELWAITINATM